MGLPETASCTDLLPGETYISSNIAGTLPIASIDVVLSSPAAVGVKTASNHALSQESQHRLEPLGKRSISNKDSDLQQH